MVDLKASGIQIVTSVIGSGILLFAITTGYSEFNKPNVSATFVPNIDDTSIELTNNGRVPATNLILTVESPENISNYKIFTTENWTIMVEEDNHTLVAKFPRFVQGDGSFIKIAIFSGGQQGNAVNQNYTVYATYDQGSLKMSSQMQQATISTPYGLTIALTITALLVFAIPYFYRRTKRNRQRQYNMLVSYVAENVSYVNQYCERDPSYFENLNIIGLIVAFNVHEDTARTIIGIARGLNEFKGIFKDERDFDLVSLFYTESAHLIIADAAVKSYRGEKLEGEMRQGLQKNRAEIARIAKRTLAETPWQKYDVNITDIDLKVSSPNYSFVSTAQSLIKFRRYNITIKFLQPMLAILAIPIVLSIGSFVISGDSLEWIQRFEIYHWLLFAGAVFLGIIIFFSRQFSDLVSKFAERVAKINIVEIFSSNFTCASNLALIVSWILSLFVRAWLGLE